jgi:hypothetical protein
MHWGRLTQGDAALQAVAQALWHWRRVVGLGVVAAGLWVLLTGLVGCTKAVTVHGQPVTDEFFRSAAQTVSLAEQVLASVPPALIHAHERGAISVLVLQQYQQEVIPVAQTALDAAKNALITYALQQTETTRGALQAALVTLQDVALRASDLLTHSGVH